MATSEFTFLLIWQGKKKVPLTTRKVDKKSTTQKKKNGKISNQNKMRNRSFKKRVEE